MTRRWTLALALAAGTFATAALAQNSPPPEGTVILSEPGKAEAIRTVELSAKIVGIDKSTRTVTLKTASGDPIDVVADKAVRNFDQIKVGDSVTVRYTQALALELRKTKAEGGEATVSEEVTRARPGERPSGNLEREVTAIAEVTDVDPQDGTITLRGPRGNVVVLDVHNPDQFKVVKKGDQVNVTYTAAIALSVEAASASSMPNAPKTEK